MSNLAAAKAENAENRLMAVQPVSSVRLDFDEIEFRPIAVVGALSKLTTKAIKLAQVLEQVGAERFQQHFQNFQTTRNFRLDGGAKLGCVGELKGTGRHIRWRHRERVA